MKDAWNDLKSFITVAMIILLFVVVIASLLGYSIPENLLILITNLITAVFTYYFAKKDKSASVNKEEKQDDKDIQ